jgi:hypothetical protein
MSVAAAAGGYAGLFSLVGVKYTTAPIAAGRAVATVRNWLNGDSGGTARQPAASARTVVRANRHVPGIEAFLTLATSVPREAGELVDGIVQDVSVHSWSDLVLRRTDWGLDPSNHDRAEAALRALRPGVFSPDG